MKIVIIGAGSGFGSRLSTDILSSPALEHATIALCDLDATKLEGVRAHVQHFIDYHKLPARCVADIDRHALLPGADSVVTAVSVGGPAYYGEPYTSEICIPRKYGVDQFVGDTIGPGGVFRFLRTAHQQLQFCKDMERHCPEALMLNYTNPMAMLTWMHTKGSFIRNIGLCHSVQGTTKKLARALNIPYEEVSYLVAGINHQAWVMRFMAHGQDLYPRLRDAIETHSEFEGDAVRVELMRQFGYYVTESTFHLSEYLPYFRTTPERLKQFKLFSREIDPNPEIKHVWEADSGIDEKGDPKAPPRIRSHEYASSIIEALETDVPFCFNGNVMNTGLIDNLPNECCVEVPCVANRQGVQACHVGRIPTQCAALNRTNINVQELAVEAVLNLDREAAFHAVALDPLTAAVLPLDKIREMFDELWEAEGTLLAPWNG